MTQRSMRPRNYLRTPVSRRDSSAQTSTTGSKAQRATPPLPSPPSPPGRPPPRSSGRESGKGCCLEFDVVYSSCGFVIWLSDLRRWARGIQSVLAPGGRLACIEFYPVLEMYDLDWTRIDGCFQGGFATSYPAGPGDYVAASGPSLTPSDWTVGLPHFLNPHPGHEWLWGIGNVLAAILEAGLSLSEFTEYPFTNACRLYNRMRPGVGNRWYPPDVASLATMFALSTHRLSSPAGPPVENLPVQGVLGSPSRPASRCAKAITVSVG